MVGQHYLTLIEATPTQPKKMVLPFPMTGPSSSGDI